MTPSACPRALSFLLPLLLLFASPLGCEIDAERKDPTASGTCVADADCPSGYSCVTSADDERFCAKSGGGGGDVVVGEDVSDVDAADPVADTQLPDADSMTPDTDTTLPDTDIVTPDTDAEVEDVEITDPANPIPVLTVAPELVDFGPVAAGHTSTREVTLTNQGTGDLIISSVTLSLNDAGEFSLSPGEDFGPLAPTPAPHTLAPQETVSFEVAYTNGGDVAAGDALGEITIASNDPGTPSLKINLKATPVATASCELVFVPSLLDFGVVAFGQDGVMTMDVRNVGSGSCTFKSAHISDCGGFGGLGGTCEPQNTIPSAHYQLMGVPPPIPDGIPPGGEVSLAIRFTPEEGDSLFDFNDYPALLVVTYEESYSAGGQPTEHTLPDASAGAASPNINGKGGDSDIAALPTFVDFGAVTVGCYSEEREVTLYNRGDAALDVVSLAITSGCPSMVEFMLVDIAPLPQVVSAQGSMTVSLRYLPQDLGPDTCTLSIGTSDPAQPLFIVPLEGEGTFEATQTDTFVQGAGSAVDILFVVDSSGSMSPAKEALAASISALTALADAWDSDYQIGVMGLGIDEGCDNTGTLQGEPPILQNNTTGFSDRVLNVDQGGCAPDAQEAGLEASFLALSWPLIHDADEPCATDADCASPYQCVDGGCGGPNRGFLREDAALEVVIISDEEDQSPGPVGFYVDFLDSLKGPSNPHLMHLHAIVGDPGDGCVSSDGNLQAGAGHRYIEVQQATGGVFRSICAGDFAATLASIGVVVFGPTMSLALSRDADPATIEVTVNGTACDSGWIYDAPSNAVVFHGSGDCLPLEGDTVTIHYAAACAAP